MNRYMWGLIFLFYGLTALGSKKEYRFESDTNPPIRREKFHYEPYRFESDINPRTRQEFYYSERYNGFSQKSGFETAVVIFGYNRPHYFQEVLKALEENPEAQELPFFFILDGGKKAKQGEYIEMIYKSPIKHKFIIERPINYGLHFNIIAGLRFLFDWCEFTRVIHFEDDVVVTPTYLGLMLRLDKWAHKHYDNIGAVQGFRPCKMPVEEKIRKREIVAETPGLWLGYCMRKSVWDDIKDIMYEYEDNFLGGKRLESKVIKPWMKEKIKHKKVFKDIPDDKRWASPHDPYYDDLTERGVGQCGMLTMSLYLKGYVRLTMIANRAINIGEEGANYKSSKWHNHFDGVTLDIIEGDDTLVNFAPLMKVVY